LSFSIFTSEEDFQVKRGDRVAQLILERICMADCVEVEDLPDTERGTGGFGSTGVRNTAEDEATKRARLEDGNSK
jgi:dUTPase